VDLTHGGRATLRLDTVSETAAAYTGELVTAEARFLLSVRVVLADGAIEISVDGDAPQWLVDVARTTLRTAWRANQAGAEWPRRVSRWRAAKDEERA
jgi:hypothetical protein